MMSDQALEEREKPLLGSMSDWILKLLLPGLMSDRIPKPLLPGQMSNLAQEEHEKLLLDLMLHRIHGLAKSAPPISMSDQISELPAEVDFFDPATTLLVANVEDLTKILDGYLKEPEDEEEEVGESAESQPPATRRWQATSTYECYMVETPNASNNGGGSDDGANDNNGTNGNGPESPPRDDSCDEDRNPRSEFGPFDEDILNESMGSVRHDECRERLIRSAKKVVRDREQLLARARAVEDRWQ